MLVGLVDLGLGLGLLQRARGGCIICLYRSFNRIAVECGFRFDSWNTILVGIAIV